MNQVEIINLLYSVFFFSGPGHSDLPRASLASLGILGMGIAFPTAYLYSGELFPTVVRNVGVGSGSMCARIGSMIAPFIASLVRTYPLQL